MTLSADAKSTPPTPALTNPGLLEVERQMGEEAMRKYRGLLLVLGVGYGIICLLSIALIVYLRRNRTVAFRGDSSAARKVILPAYLPLLGMEMAMALVYSIYFWVLRAISTDPSKVAGNVENEVYFSMRIFFILIVVVYMYQKSVTKPALRRAAFITFLISTYNIPVVWFAETYLHNPGLIHWVPQFARILVVIFCLWVFVMPPERASKRSLREYIAFVLVYYALFFVYSELFEMNYVDSGFMFAYANILWGSFCPLVIWRVLKADTEHWRGLGRRAVTLQSLFRQKNRINERISSRGLHLLIEMHRKYIIDFAYLELKHKIGTGSSAVVFNGVLNSKTPVAIKVYSPTELTDEVVAEFSHEAALCGALHHPNIVKFYGMCVCPPTICLVSELCLGSLDVVTKAIARRHHDSARQQLMIDLNYMIDATRAVAYLHSFSPAFLHRDIKPGNFLVDRKCVVKLTDFGESRSLPRECVASRSASVRSSKLQGLDDPNDASPALLSRVSLDGWVGMGAETSLSSSLRRPAMTVRGTAEYMAPELIQGKAGTALYGEAADIFSLAMTLWDIAYPLSDKYPRANGNHLKVFEGVLAGERPQFDADFHVELSDLISRAWDPQPEKRPSALALLTALEKIHMQVSSEVAAVLANAMEKKIMISRKGCTTEPTCAGQDLVQKMLEFDVVDSVEEAVRVGNGLMSSGLLHHARHIVGFESSSEQYMFDEVKLDALVRPHDRLHLPPIVERRRRSSSAAIASVVPESGPVLPHDDDASSCAADEWAELNDDGDSVFGCSVGPQVSKKDEGREVEGTSVASTISNTVGELLRFGPRRKLSRGGVSDSESQQRRLSTQPTHATSSQWMDTTTADPSVCPCRRLGAGLMYITKRTGSNGGVGSINKRFRRGKRTASNASHLGDSQSHGVFTTPPGGVSSGGRTSRTASAHSAVDSGLTARLLMNEFSNTGSSEPYDDSPVPTPASTSDVEMGFHVADASDEEHEHPLAQERLPGRRTRGRRADGRADSNSSSTFEGSSSVESSTVVHPVDMA